MNIQAYVRDFKWENDIPSLSVFPTNLWRVPANSKFAREPEPSEVFHDVQSQARRWLRKVGLEGTPS